MLPLLALPALVSGAGKVAQGVGNALADRKQQQYNKEQLNKLMELQKKGQLGLTGQERRTVHQGVFAPAAQAAMQARTRAEQLGAAGGQTGGADLSRLQQQQAQQGAMAQQQASQIVNAANLQKQQQQRQEIEQRLQAKSAMAKNDVNSIAEPIIDLAATGAGAYADVKTQQKLDDSATAQEEQLMADAEALGIPPEQFRLLRSLYAGQL
jgi:hypothetical protein